MNEKKYRNQNYANEIKYTNQNYASKRYTNQEK